MSFDLLGETYGRDSRNLLHRTSAPDSAADSDVPASITPRSFDAFDELLRGLRVSSSIVLHDTYHASWSIDVPPSKALAELVARPSADRVVAFHYVEHGCVEIITTHTPPVRLGQGDLVITLGGHGHQLRHGNPTTTVPLARLLQHGHTPTQSSTGNNNDEDRTTLLCGVFVLDQLNRTGLSKTLPDLVTLRSEQSLSLTALAQNLTREADEPQAGHAYMTARLLEALLAEALRMATLHRRSTQPPAPMGDPIVWTAIAAIHDDPAAPWTAESLGRVAAMSPSRLTTRFRTALGESPMGYVAKWRMTLAAELLATTDLSIEQIGHHVGYANQPAFTRAYRRHLGTAPSEWREHRRSCA